MSYMNNTFIEDDNEEEFEDVNNIKNLDEGLNFIEEGMRTT